MSSTALCISVLLRFLFLTNLKDIFLTKNPSNMFNRTHKMNKFTRDI